MAKSKRKVYILLKFTNVLMVRLVCDSSILILLAKTSLLRQIYLYTHKLSIPEDVFKEVVIKGRENNKVDALLVEREIKNKKILVAEIKEKDMVKELLKNFKFSAGEAQAIALTIQENSILGTDDREAIKACKVYGISFITALGFLIKISQDKKISKEDASIKIEQLKSIGYYSENIILNAIEECEKIWNK
ncbi:hypothetical protein HYT51_02470 [Candidatus Woesearchaeota archaeon]|nr:hypothetical protein [Candidatus Woesearchaeota archaeon]